MFVNKTIILEINIAKLSFIEQGFVKTSMQIIQTIYYLFLRVRQWSGRPGFNPKSSHTNDSKNGTWCFLA